MTAYGTAATIHPSIAAPWRPPWSMPPGLAGWAPLINGQGIMQSPVVREHAGIAEDQVIMKSIALGWPDETFPANAVVSERKSVEEATVFVGFEK